VRTAACESVREWLEAYHDGELSVEAQILVRAHLDDCRYCAASVARLGAISSALRTSATAGKVASDELSGLSGGIVSRILAEQREALTARIGRMFEDMHLVWAGLSGTVATLCCGVLMSGLLYVVATNRTADSLAGILAALDAPEPAVSAPAADSITYLPLVTPGSNGNPLIVDGHLNLPRVLQEWSMLGRADGAGDTGDYLLALTAVVTQEGRVTQSELLLEDLDDRTSVTALMQALRATRFEPASIGGVPVAVNLVWLVTKTTVRGNTLG